MIKPSYPWPCPPPTPQRDGYRSEAYHYHNCGSAENTLGVGTWLSDCEGSTQNRLVLCKTCYERLNHEMLSRDFIRSLKTRFKVLFTGKL